MEHDKNLLNAADHFMENDETLDRFDQENRTFSAGKYGFMSGAEWQKEQDSDLLKALQDLVEKYFQTNYIAINSASSMALFDSIKAAKEAIIKAGGVR